MKIFILHYPLLILVSIILFESSCTTSGPSGIFGKKSPHEQYGDKIKNAGLNETALGKQWFSVAEKSLVSPLSVNLPYSETGYFPAEQPKAVGIVFKGKRGEKLTIQFSKKPEMGFAVYLDLWQSPATGETNPKFLISADTTTTPITYDVEKDGNYILRLQPELLKGGEYTISVTTGPSLAFPVSPKVKSNIGSFWGAGRDAGARSHEGIDIFAPKRSVLVAAADGVVTRVIENKLGGKVVFLRPDNKDFTLYYAHLDEQLVQSGQIVKVGDTIGLVGNTGNAKTTAPHLHFGIYTNSGAIDPLPFVNSATKAPERITAPLKYLDNFVRNTKPVALITATSASAKNGLTVEANTLMKVEAATGGWYKVTLPGGESGFVTSGLVTPVTLPVRKVYLKTEQVILDEPNNLAARKSVLTAGQSVAILGSYKDFYYIDSDNKVEGWLPKKSL